MKKTILILNLLLCIFTIIQAQDVTALLISKSDNSYVGYLLRESPIIEFKDQSFNVKLNGNVDSYCFEDVTMMSYVSDQDLASTGITTSNNNDAVVKFNNENIIVSSSKKSVIKVVDISGKLLYINNIDENSSIKIELNQFGNGIYILSIDSLIFKFSI